MKTDKLIETSLQTIYVSVKRRGDCVVTKQGHGVQQATDSLGISEYPESMEERAGATIIQQTFV